MGIVFFFAETGAGGEEAEGSWLCPRGFCQNGTGNRECLQGIRAGGRMIACVAFALSFGDAGRLPVISVPVFSRSGQRSPVVLFANFQIFPFISRSRKQFHEISGWTNGRY